MFRHKGRYLVAGVIAVVVFVLGRQSVAYTDTTQMAGQAGHTTVVRVMGIGGSVAHGWKDPNHNGYLQRAFTSLTQETATAYDYFDQTIVGANSTQLDTTMYKGRYAGWLASLHPNVVVISWGLLNDALPKVPIDSFGSHIQYEISLGLQAHAMVFLVTPPVTKASYTQYKVTQQQYVDTEIAVARALHNPNVYVFDVFDQMKQYLVDHHQTYEPYFGDGWHPNTAGHILAGRILSDDIMKQFGSAAPQFHDTSATGSTN